MPMSLYNWCVQYIIADLGEQLKCWDVVHEVAGSIPALGMFSEKKNSGLNFPMI